MNLTRYQLDNGMQVVLQQQKAAPVVACNVWVGVGSADEEPREAGLAHVHEHMLFKGTQRRGVGEIAREVEAAGGHINAFTSFDQTCYYVVMSSRFFDTGLDILSDAIRHSSFDAEELERELEVIQEEIKRGQDHPPRVASKLMFETAFATHPYRLPVIGTKESVDSFGRDDVVSFFQKHYVPDNMALVLVGDFELDEARALVDKHFGDFDRGDYERLARQEEPEQDGFRAKIAHEDLQQAHLRMAFHIPNAVHDDIPALDLLGAVMGFGEASQLHRAIKRERQLVSSIYSGAYTPMDAGLFVVSAEYQPDERRTHEEVVRAILDEVFRFREMKVSDSEIRRARTLIESQEIYNKQTVEGLAMKLGRYEMITGDPEYEKRYYEALARVTPADIRRVAREYLTPDNASAVLLGPKTDQPVTEDDLETICRGAYETSQADAIDTGLRPDELGFARVDVPDGPTLLVQENHSVETVSVRALTLGGLRFETPQNNGINHLLDRMIIRGTHERSAEEIAHEVESMASSVDGMSGRNSFGMAMTALSRFFEPVFEIFADCLLDSTLPEEEFERERSLQLQNIRSRRDKLGAVNFDRFTRAFFGDYPYGMPTIGTTKSVESITVEQARDYYRKIVQPAGLVLSVVGDVSASEVAELVERHLVRPDSPELWRPDVDGPPKHHERTLAIGDLDKEQAFVTVGFEAPTIGDDSRYALEVLYAILSGQGGRLFYELRDKQSLAYSVYASMIFGLDISTFTVNIGTSPEKIEQALTGMIGEISKLRADGVTQIELDRAKRFLIGNHDIGLQKNSARAMSFALDELYGFSYRKTLDFSDRINAVELDDIAGVVDAYLDPDVATVSITKPPSVDVSDDILNW